MKIKAKVIDYHTLKRQWSAPGVPQVDPYFIVFPFFTKEDGATFSMRYHTVLPGRPDPPLHAHSWEHQTFTISGKGALLTEEGEMAIQEGMVVFVPPDLPHIMVCRGELPWVTIDCISTV